MSSRPGLQKWPASKELFGQPICLLLGPNPLGRVMAKTLGAEREPKVRRVCHLYSWPVPL